MAMQKRQLALPVASAGPIVNGPSEAGAAAAAVEGAGAASAAISSPGACSRFSSTHSNSSLTLTSPTLSCAQPLVGVATPHTMQLMSSQGAVGGAVGGGGAAGGGSCNGAGGGGGGRMILHGHPSQYVKLNVGGSLYHTTIGTLTKHDNMLRAMFSGRMEVLTDPEGWIMIDRCGKHFGTILNFLRDGSVCLPENRRDLSELLAEAKYFCIEELADAVDKGIKNLMAKHPANAEVVPICRVPLITSHKEEQALITANQLPMVKLLVNRHNNKFSYTANSDDQILKNIELFDKLSLRFSDRITFIKDVIGSDEICSWTFYGNGKKNASLSCTAIVHAADRRITKIDFPEARIYENTLNCLLYEGGKGPDKDLMQATSTRPSLASMTSDDEDERHRCAGGGGHHHYHHPSSSSQQQHNSYSHGEARGGSGSGNGGGSGSGSEQQQQPQQQPQRASGLSRLRSSKNSSN